MGSLREAHRKFLVIDATFSCLTGLIGGSSVKKNKMVMVPEYYTHSIARDRHYCKHVLS